MVDRRETKKQRGSDKNIIKTKREYEKSFLKAALLLCVYQTKYGILSGITNFVFSGRNQKATKFLRFVNKAVNKNICQCQILAEKCEFFKSEIENFTIG